MRELNSLDDFLMFAHDMYEDNHAYRMAITAIRFGTEKWAYDMVRGDEMAKAKATSFIKIYHGLENLYLTDLTRDCTFDSCDRTYPLEKDDADYFESCHLAESFMQDVDYFMQSVNTALQTALITVVNNKDWRQCNVGRRFITKFFKDTWWVTEIIRNGLLAHEYYLTTIHHEAGWKANFDIKL